MKHWTQYHWDRSSYEIVAGTRSLEVILEFDGAGDRVSEKLAFSQETASRILQTFAKRHQLILITSVELSPHSHWVLRHKGLSEALKPLAERPSPKVGAIFGDSSHPQNLEFIGPQSEKGALGFDELLLDIPNRLDALHAGMISQRQDMTIFMGAVGTMMNKLTELLSEMKKVEAKRV